MRLRTGPSHLGLGVRRRNIGRHASVAAVVLVLLGIVVAVPGHTDPELRPANQVTSAQLKATKDAFGISYLQPTMRGGTYWISRWDKDRTFPGVDPQDAWFDADHGSSTHEVTDHQLVISGDTPRMYVHDPQLKRQWRDVEITMYVKRVADSGIPFAGYTAVARTNHLKTEAGAGGVCDTRGYGGRLRFDGDADFEKETAHPRNEATSRTTVFPDGMPRGVWIGVKLLVFDQSDGVHLEMWLDQSNGSGGGDWQLINQVVDDGKLFGDAPCADGIDPAAKLTAAPTRKGSESGEPNVSVYFRSDGIGPSGLVYKWGSIREIAP